MTTKRFKESDIEKEVCEYATHYYSALVRKLAYPGRKGAPDRMFVFPNGEILFIEFKAPGKGARPDQQREIDMMDQYHINAEIIDNVQLGKELVDRVAL